MPDNTDPRKLPPPASHPEDCAVGPTDSEISNPSTFVYWGHDHASNISKEKDTISPQSKKRKNCDSENGEQNQKEPSSFETAIGSFLSSGCCFINKPVLPPYFVKTCLERAKADYKFLNTKMDKEREKILHDGNHHRMVALSRQDYAEWVARDGGRVDIRYGLNEYPYNCGGLIYNSIVFPLVKALLNGEESIEREDDPVQLLYVGIMWGMPIGGSKNKDSCCHHQKWHADGGHLFSPHQLPKGLTLPPHCINVFYPLVDLTQDNGPTEFRIASHRRDDVTKDEEFPLLCPAGSAVLFDYRIQHRGRANLLEPATATSTPDTAQLDIDIDRGRPVLYLAYAKTYFKDHGNTRSGRRLVPSGNASSWATRTLQGRPVPYGKGFENYALNEKQEEDVNFCADNDEKKNDESLTRNDETNTTASSSEENPNNSVGVGERWILFQMTLELPDGKSEILKVHKGDVAVEVAQQFCFKHGLLDDFVSVLAQTIQAQMDAV